MRAAHLLRIACTIKWWLRDYSAVIVKTLICLMKICEWLWNAHLEHTIDCSWHDTKIWMLHSHGKVHMYPDCWAVYLGIEAHPINNLWWPWQQKDAILPHLYRTATSGSSLQYKVCKNHKYLSCKICSPNIVWVRVDCRCFKVSNLWYFCIF